MKLLSKISMLFVLLTTIMLSSVSTAVFAADDEVDVNSAHAVLAPFIEKEVVLGDAVMIEDKQKHEVLFYMGVLLLILIVTTAVIGLRMALFGKKLFVQHMISAGFTVFLAFAHAVTAIVWFFPFTL
ncbi:MAG: hypothetical protein COB33_012900 [Thiotrichaceae bacterium]|nr:hypothetical protein [Thiotrichaceae bacterium]PCI14798.1 MAG: hypothetical protein COB71_01700 [Thiotrichales bacterium]